MSLVEDCRATALVVAVGLAICGFSAQATASPPGRSAAELETLRYEARAYEHGEGVARDAVHAAALYCDGARDGDAEAQFSLGWMYANGRGLPRNDELAAYFFTLAAAQGHQQAKTLLRLVTAIDTARPDCMHAALDEAEPEAVTAAQRAVLGLVRKLAPEYGISQSLVMAVIRTESNFQPGVVSPKNAQGLMQLIPETSLRFSVKKPLDPEQNIRGGLAYLRWLLAYFEGDVSLVAAAYNAGEGAVNRYRGVPPYAETRNYVKRITSLFKNSAHPYDPAVTAPSPQLARIRVTQAL